MRSEGAALYLDQIAGTSSLQSHNWVGQRIPLHATANGKVLLSGLTPDPDCDGGRSALPRLHARHDHVFKKLLIDIELPGRTVIPSWSTSWSWD